jgi:hypothetical protein
LHRASLVLHALILTIHFKFPEALRWKPSQHPLEVILVNAKTDRETGAGGSACAGKPRRRRQCRRAAPG